MKKYDIIVIGGDAAGMSAASQARRTLKDISIAVFERSSDVSYAACGMPYFIADEVKESSSLLAINKDDFIKNRKIEIFTDSEVYEISIKEKVIKVYSSRGDESYNYNKLIIATGARAVTIPIPGIDSDRIFTLRKLEDGINIKNLIINNLPESAIIIGGGFIGLEMAEAFRKLNIQTAIVEKMESVAMTTSPMVRKLITDKLIENDVKIYTSKDIEYFESIDDKVRVNLKDMSLDAGIVILSVGIRPNTEFLKKTGIDINDRGVIQVNEKSETNIPGVYAAGDCASVKNLITGRSDYIPLGTTANKQGRVAGLQAAGVEGEILKGVVGSQFVKVFDLEIGKTGLNDFEANKIGIPCRSVNQKWKSRAGYYPGAAIINTSLTINSKTREIIGCEIAGTDGAALRINAIATAITAKMTVDDFAYLDFGYAPPFSPVWDPLLAAAQKLKKM